MENRNLDKALEIISRLISNEEVGEKATPNLYQEYVNNGEVYDIVALTAKKLNLSVYEYNNALYVSPGENNRVFGFTNEELRKEIGVKTNKEMYLGYFVIYNIITEFYNDTLNSTYAEFIRLEDTIQCVDRMVSTIIDRRAGLIVDEIEENSFKQIALSWDELPVATTEDASGSRAARNSRSGFVKMIYNFLVRQGLLMEAQGRFYATDRFRALIENYFDEYRGRLAELMKEQDRAKADN